MRPSGRARRLTAAGAPLTGVLLSTLAAAADGARSLAEDEYDALMTSVAAWVIEAYADGRDGGTVPDAEPPST